MWGNGGKERKRESSGKSLGKEMEAWRVQSIRSILRVLNDRDCVDHAKKDGLCIDINWSKNVFTIQQIFMSIYCVLFSALGL